MKLKYTGPKHHRRVIESYTWEASNGHTTMVWDHDDLANFLTLPGPEFVVASDEPLWKIEGMTDNRIVALVMAGVASVHALANADPKELAAATGESVETATGWVEQAREAKQLHS